MITLSMFQEYLSFTESQPLSSNQSINGQESYLLKLLAELPSQVPAQQAEQLEKVLTALRGANIEERQRLKLIATVIDASDQLIATLRQHYIYETGALSDDQLVYVDQIKSLYYLIIMAYDTVIRHKEALLNSQQKNSARKGWQRYFNTNKSVSMTLAVAIYQTLVTYQKLLAEEAICYQNPSPLLWSKINQLYDLAYQHHVADIDLNVTTVTRQADNIHGLYCQICLHSLLNVCAMQRPNILLVQRLLPEWAKHIVATIEPKTETRVFVDLHSDKPPRYLTANSDINPYEDRYHCLFIELTPMIEYLESRIKILCDNDSEGVECYLLTKISMMVSYRYLQPPRMLATQYSIKKEAVLITGFNNIHYRVSHSKNFASLIAMDELPNEYRPLYDTVKQKHGNKGILISETVHGNDSSPHFRILSFSEKSEGLLATEREKLQVASEFGDVSDVIGESAALFNTENLTVVSVDDEVTTTAPPPLCIMNFFLVCRSETSTPPDWSMGVVRWLNLDGKNPEVEWQVLGHTLVACGLRIEGRDAHIQHFVPAFILGRDEQLQTTGTVIVPTSYFSTNDRVIMRINNKQTSLRLGQRLLFTDEFSQYEVIKL